MAEARKLAATGLGGSGGGGMAPPPPPPPAPFHQRARPAASKKAAGSSLLDTIRNVDAFPKTIEEFRVRTLSGAGVSLCAILIMFILFVSEFSFYLSTDTTEFMEVDQLRGQKLKINFDITFPSMSCSVVHLDVMDSGGKHQLDVDHNVRKRRIDLNGNEFGALEENELRETITTPDELLEVKRKAEAEGKDTEAPKVAEDAGSGSDGVERCGSCYGAGEPGQCCTSCEEVRELYAKKGWAFKPSQMEQCQKEGFVRTVTSETAEGCRISGQLEVPRVAGNFHFAPGRSFQHAHMHVHDLMSFTVGNFNITHQINHLSFGEDYPDMVNPLDGYGFNMGATSGMYQYYIKVVPTEYHTSSGRVTDTNQYSATDHMRKLDSRGGQGLPGVFFFFDVSPIRVRIEETSQSFAHFLTGCCAIIGGVFTVMGLVDKAVHKIVQRSTGGL